METFFCIPEGGAIAQVVVSPTGAGFLTLRSVHRKPAAEWRRGVGLAFGALKVPMGQVRGSLSVLHPEVDFLLKSQSKQQEMHSFNAF